MAGRRPSVPIGVDIRFDLIVDTQKLFCYSPHFPFCAKHKNLSVFFVPNVSDLRSDRLYLLTTTTHPRQPHLSLSQYGLLSPISFSSLPIKPPSICSNVSSNCLSILLQCQVTTPLLVIPRAMMPGPVAIVNAITVVLKNRPSVSSNYAAAAK